ncbi:MAG TPA: o-succinylbenzoate synthase [Bacteroidales bacterium]|nr:o-succinylbenzoate synthase [Bacteroidales bacterium]
MQAGFFKHTLQFKQPGGTSRGVLNEKPSWFLLISDGMHTGIGEISIIPGLSQDDHTRIEAVLKEVCRMITKDLRIPDDFLLPFPAVRFGLETARLDLQRQGSKELFSSAFTRGEKPIRINGLIWMGEQSYMQQQIREKIEQGYHCIKLKIGNLDFEQEISLLKGIRQEFPASDMELRVDANGAFASAEAPEKLERLATLDIHSIEQPIRQGQPQEMAALCATSPLPIALDEELIGIAGHTDKQQLLETIRPQYIILKPSLTGGLAASEEWIRVADSLGIDWWITSALEANIGLNAIAQWTWSLNKPVTHGLGTGMLYTNNIPSPLTIQNAALYYDTEKDWDLSIFTSRG